MRTLIETLDDAYCSDLRRVAIGPFRVDDAGARGPDRARSPSWSRRSATRFGENVGLMSIKVTPLEEASRAPAMSRSAPSTASISATGP